MRIYGKKRLGLTKSKLEYIFEHLGNKTEWNEFEETFYNIYKPEYTIEIIRDDEDLYPEFYTFAMPNKSTSYEILNIKYQQTVLDSFQIVVLDGGRLSVPTPLWSDVIREKSSFDKKYGYKYYEKDSKRYKVLSFLYDPQNSDHRFAFYHYEDVVLFFKSKEERIKFELYVEENKEDFEERFKSEKRNFEVHLNEGMNKEIYYSRLKTGCVLSKMLKEWRTNQKDRFINV